MPDIGLGGPLYFSCLFEGASDINSVSNLADSDADNASNLDPIDDPYDPRKPQFVISSSREEAFTAELFQLKAQAQRLEEALRSRADTMEPKVRGHYECVLEETHKRAADLQRRCRGVYAECGHCPSVEPSREQLATDEFRDFDEGHNVVASESNSRGCLRRTHRTGRVLREASLADKSDIRMQLPGPAPTFSRIPPNVGDIVTECPLPSPFESCPGTPELENSRKFPDKPGEADHLAMNFVRGASNLSILGMCIRTPDSPRTYNFGAYD